jgi:rhodanese-related sulfurtransferase
MVKDISAKEFLDRRSAGTDMTLLDVREDWELAVAPVPSPTVHIPMGAIAQRIGELDANKETVVICRSGARSGQVAQWLDARGFTSVFNLSGGILAWSRDIDPRIAQY